MEYVYAALLLHKSGKPVDEEGLKKVLTATGAEVDESKVKSLIASLKDINIDKELENAVIASAAPATGGNASADSGDAKTEEAPKEEPKEASAAGLSALFG
jgi:large subunit ribosomal protein L12